MAEHMLKCWTSYFHAIREGRKTFEVRKWDRDFAIGDILRLTEFDPQTGYAGRGELNVRVTYLMPGGSFGIASDHCVMAIKIEEPA